MTARASSYCRSTSCQGNTLYIPLTIDGTTAWVMIDSGYSASFTFPDSMAQELDFVDRPVRLPSSTATFHGSVANYAARLKGSVLLGRNKFVNPIIRIQGNKPLIGSDVLKHFVVTINPRKKVAFFPVVSMVLSALHRLFGTTGSTSGHSGTVGLSKVLLPALLWIN